MFAFLSKNGCSEFSTLVLETLNLQNSLITLFLTSNEQHNNKQTRTTKNNTPNKMKA
jgi:hypothetical protein